MSQTDLSKLATDILEWERKKKELDALEQTIQAAVLELRKTQTVGNVKVTYSGGRKTYDYKEAADGHPMVSSATIKLFTTFPTAPPPKVDWNKICQHVGISKKDTPFKAGVPSAKIKLV